MGRTLALKLVGEGFTLTLFDKDAPLAQNSCGYTGAGMLAFFSELDHCDAAVYELGKDSITRWADIIRGLPTDVYLQNPGTIALAHPHDGKLLTEFARAINAKLQDRLPDINAPPRWLTAKDLQQLEPEISHQFTEGFLLPKEGNVDGLQLMNAMAAKLEALDVEWYHGELYEPGCREVSSNLKKYTGFDLVVDCRGIGAQSSLSSLRSVRGELIHLRAPEVIISHPIRLMHPRYSIYIVPRANSVFLVGATSIESSDSRRVTVQSTMELLSAATVVHRGFAESEILDLRANHRPAFADNLPKILYSEGLLHVNGLYRHGFLLAPKIADLACSFIQEEPVDTLHSSLFRTTAEVGTTRLNGG